jgi:hypothetical protein
MHKLALLSLLAAAAAAVHAQSPCAPPTNSPTALPFNAQTANGYVYYTAYGQSATQVAPFLGSVSLALDINCTGPLTINGFDVGYMFNDGQNGPNLASPPTVCTVNVWECPTSWAGNAITWPGVWTQIGTATGTFIGPWYGTTPFTLNAPTSLAQGAHGIMLEFVAIQNMPCTQYNAVTTPWTPWEPMVFPSPTTPLHADSFVSINNLGWQINSFNTLPRTSLTVTQPPAGTYLVDFPSFVWHYTPAAGAAYFTQFGAGCVDNPKSFRDRFFMSDPNNLAPFDLSNSTLAMIPSGSQYIVSSIPGAPTWYTHLSTNLNISSPPASLDDGLYPTITLPFTFPFAGGSTNIINIGTNGILYLEATTRTGGYYDGNTAWCGDAASLAVAYGDLDESNIAPPSSPGTPYGVWYDIDPSGQQVYITWFTQEWLGVGTNNTMSFQILLDASGYIEYRYQSVTMEPLPGSGAPLIVGWTPGHGVHVPAPIDLDVIGSFTTGNDTSPTSITLNARPVLGTTTGFVTTNVFPGTIAGVTVLGFGDIPGGIPIPGAPGCSVYGLTFLSNLVTLGTTFFPVGTFTNNLTLPPVSSGLAGLVVVSQSALLIPAASVPGNSLNVLTSNGLCVGLGNF